MRPTGECLDYLLVWGGSDVEFDAPDVDGSALVYIAVLGAFWLDMGTTADYSNML